jgi:hypothetical protein
MRSDKLVNACRQGLRKRRGGLQTRNVGSHIRGADAVIGADNLIQFCRISIGVQPNLSIPSPKFCTAPAGWFGLGNNLST